MRNSTVRYSRIYFRMDEQIIAAFVINSWAKGAAAISRAIGVQSPCTAKYDSRNRRGYAAYGSEPPDYPHLIVTGLLVWTVNEGSSPVAITRSKYLSPASVRQRTDQK